MAIVRGDPPFHVLMYDANNLMHPAWRQWFLDTDLITGRSSGLGGLADQDGSDATTGGSGLTGDAANLAVDIPSLTETQILNEDSLMFADASDDGNLKRVAAKDLAVLSRGFLQIKVSSNTDEASTNSVIPYDNTKPQSSEGQQVLIMTFTPQSSNSILLFTFSSSCYANSSAVVFSIYQDNEIDPRYTWHCSVGGPHVNPIYFQFSTPSAGTQQRQYKIRCGPEDTGTITMLRSHTNTSVFGGAQRTELKIMEFLNPPTTAID